MIFKSLKNTFNGVTYYKNTNLDIAYILVYDQMGHILVTAMANYKIQSQNTIFVTDSKSEFLEHIQTHGLFISSKSNIDEATKVFFEL